MDNLGPVHYSNISLLLTDIEKALASDAKMFAILGVLVGLEIIAKEWYFNVPYKRDCCKQLDCYKEFAKNKSGEIFKEGIKALGKLPDRNIEALWQLRNRLAHAFTLPSNFTLHPAYAPGTKKIQDDQEVINSALVFQGANATGHVLNLVRLLDVCHQRLVTLSVQPDWQEVHELMVVSPIPSP